MKSIAISGIMRFTGSIAGHPVKVLLDGGSDDSFIQPRVVQFLHLGTLPTEQFKVLVGNGQFLQVKGLVPEVSLQVQGHTLTLPAYVLTITGADIILGASWLAALGLHMTDYSKLSTQFYHNN